MKKLAIFISIIIVGLFFVDRIGGAIMLQVNKNSKDVLAPKLQYIKNDIHENVVFIGNSRCHHHYIPSILEDTLKMSVYNAGVGGADNIYSDYIVLCHILNNVSSMNYNHL